VIRVKRVYDEREESDGYRILVDRLWPRGIKKEKAAIDLWMRDIAPSDALRKSFGHDPDRWDEFKRRYFKELDEKGAVVRETRRMAEQGTITLLFSAKNRELNNAVALKEYLSREGD
jgi:uncharacterized protein YeaO (DUF488 family)